MVRIMETQIRDEKKRNFNINNNANILLEDGLPPGLNKRKSFLSIFNIFGGDDKSNDGSDEEVDDGKSDVSVSDDGGDGGISTTRRTRKG
eukprot:UN05594